MTMDRTFRASDADRERVVAELQRQVGSGRLTLDEFSQRAALAYRAKTMGELADLTRDLPAERRTETSGGRRSRIPAVAAIVAAVLSLLLGGAVLTTGTTLASTGAAPGVSGEMCLHGDGTRR